MDVSQSGLAPTRMDSVAPVLGFLHGHLLDGADGTTGLDELLRALVGAFQSAGAGLATLDTGGPAVQLWVANDPERRQVAAPWHTDNRWLERINPMREALHLAVPGQPSFLIAAWDAAGTVAGLVWIEDNEGRAWTSAERAALSLTATLLGRRCTESPDLPRWAAQLDRAARQRQMTVAGQVTGRLAHDFGNVMTGILGFIELALAQATTDGPLRTYLVEAHKAAQNGALFTHQLRLLSRRQATSNQSTKLTAFLVEEQKRYRVLWGTTPPLTVMAEPGLPPVALDAEPLRQALSAMMENARDAIVALGSGTVDVTARAVEVRAADCRDWYGDVRSGPHVEICVRDTGAGVDPEIAQRLFAEPFFSTKTRKRGFGLSLAYGIVSAHRGGLDLQPGPEGGTVARLLLPAAPAPKPLRVLVVDDDPLILQFVCTTLERAGYLVQKATSAADAFQSYTAAAVDLVVSDVTMPRESGIELARRLLNQDANVRLLFMSGKFPSDCADSELVAHQFQMLAKPFRPDGLLKAVRDALARPAKAPGGRLPTPANT